MDKEQAFARFRQSFDYLKDIGILHKQSDLCEPLGIGRSHLSEFYNGKDRYFTEGNLRRFAAAYSDYINEDWLLTGEGEMKVPDKSMRPHYPATVSAGVLTGEVPSVAEDEVSYEPIVKRFGQYDYTIDVSGHSMEPTYVDKGMVACRRLYSINEIKFGKPYVIVTRDGAVIKRIISKKNSSIRVASDNPAPEYHPYSIETDSILSIDEVVGSINPENSQNGYKQTVLELAKYIYESKMKDNPDLDINEILRQIKSSKEN